MQLTKDTFCTATDGWLLRRTRATLKAIGDGLLLTPEERLGNTASILNHGHMTVLKETYDILFKGIYLKIPITLNLQTAYWLLEEAIALDRPL